MVFHNDDEVVGRVHHGVLTRSSSQAWHRTADSPLLVESVSYGQCEYAMRSRRSGSSKRPQWSQYCGSGIGVSDVLRMLTCVVVSR